ncbi:hypothetical protein TWF569_011984 [Orbilia oligospora]|nr:hypothetical protein TWF569_011984 [Orbilia oligospora]KAF3152400.1 hypothetical protein TWF594_011866 [Orbilia oligospora]
MSANACIGWGILARPANELGDSPVHSGLMHHVHTYTAPRPANVADQSRSPPESTIDTKATFLVTSSSSFTRTRTYSISNISMPRGGGSFYSARPSPRFRHIPNEDHEFEHLITASA